MSEQQDQAAAAAIDAILAATGLPVSAEERAKMIALYPESSGVAARLRLPELPGLEPARVFRAAPPASPIPEVRRP